MQKILLYIVMATLFCVQAQENNFQLYEQLPDRTQAIWRCQDLATTKEAMKTTSIYKLFNEEEVQVFLKKMIAPYKKYITGALQQVADIAQIPLEELVTILDGELAIALVDIDPKMQDFGAILALEFGEQRSKIDNLLEVAKGMLRLTFTEENYNGHTIFLVNDLPPNLSVCYAIIQDTLLISSKIELMKEIINGSEEARLKDSEKYKAITKKVHRHGVASELLYVNIERIFSFIPSDAPEAEMLKKLGVFNIKSWGLGVNIKDEYINIDSYLYCPGEKQGILSILDLDPVSLDNLYEVPSHSNGFMSINANIIGGLNKVKALLEDLDPEGSFLQMYEQGVAEVEREIGFSIENDLLKSINPNGKMYSYNYMPAEGGMFPRTISAMQINVEDYWRLTNKLASKFGCEIKDIIFADKKIYYYSQKVNMPLFNGGSYRSFEKIGNISALTFIIEDDICYFGGSMHDIKSFIEEKDSWNKGLQKNNNFSELATFLSKNTSMMWYMDFSEFFNYIWNTSIPIIRSFEGFIRKAGIPFSTAYLPQAKTISQHLKPSLFSYASDESGLLISSTSSFAISLPLVATIGIGAGIALPMIEKQKKLAKEGLVKAKLFSIVSSQELMSTNNKGSYGTLAELKKMNYVYGLHDYSDGKFEDGKYMYYIYLSKNKDRFIIYAWPKYDRRGKIFAITQKASMTSAISRNYSSWEVPKAEAAFAENVIDLDGDLAKGATGQDFNYWSSEN